MTSKCKFYNVCKIKKMSMDSWDDYVKWGIERSKMKGLINLVLSQTFVKFLDMKKILNNKNKLFHYVKCYQEYSNFVKYGLKTQEEVYECLKTQMTKNRG